MERSEFRHPQGRSSANGIPERTHALAHAVRYDSVGYKCGPQNTILKVYCHAGQNVQVMSV